MTLVDCKKVISAAETKCGVQAGMLYPLNLALMLGVKNEETNKRCADFVTAEKCRVLEEGDCYKKANTCDNADWLARYASISCDDVCKATELVGRQTNAGQTFQLATADGMRIGFVAWHLALGLVLLGAN